MSQSIGKGKEAPSVMPKHLHLGAIYAHREEWPPGSQTTDEL